MLLPRYRILFVALTICLPAIYGQTASIREVSEKMLTYPYSDPDPVPVMAISPTVSPFYPYYVFDGYTEEGTGQSDFTSPEHFFRLAEDMNAMRDYDNALENYRKCLSTAPDPNEALYRVAELFYRRTEYDSALCYAGRITENNTFDGSGNFITGMIKRISGNLVEAEEAYSVAARTMQYRSAAYAEIAGLRMQREDFNGAATFALKSLDYNNLNIQAYEILGCAYRKLNMAKKAEDCLNILLEKDPLCHFARFEIYLADTTNEKLLNFTSLIRNELPHETYLELASFYNNMGLGQDAVRVLEASPANPIVYYWLAYLLRNVDPVISETYLNKAVSMSPRLVFPHRRETIPVLEWAVSQNDSWKSKYYLGLIFWHLHRYDKTAELFERCGDIPDYAPFYICRGELFKTLPSTYCHPCSDFETAVKMDPSEWRTWHYLGTFLRSNGAFSEELKNAATAFNMFPENPVIGTDYAKALLNTGKYAECDRLLQKLKILPREVVHECHDIFEQNGISLALASADRGKIKEALRFTYYSRRWPENLGAGRPFDPDSRIQDLLSVYFYDKLGDKRSAESYRRKIADFTVSTNLTDQDPCCLYIGLKTMQGLGMSDEAAKLLTKWRTSQDSLSNRNLAAGSSSAKAGWLIAIMNNEKEKASDLKKEISAIPDENRFRLMQKAYKLIYGMNK
jgi:tetratricopeptide (TPR) repeat protein